MYMYNTVKLSNKIASDQPVNGYTPNYTPGLRSTCIYSDFIWVFGKLPFPLHLEIFFKEFGKKIPKIHKIGKIKTIFGLGMTPL